MNRNRRAGAEHAFPIAFVILALLCIVVVVPTALRPPPPQANESAEFAPDAPPDDEQESIVSSLNRASSATAGSGETLSVGGGTDPFGDGLSLPRSAPSLAPRACPRGVGSPPRQVASLYSAPCAAPFKGDNGGATYQGVTSTEIRIAYLDRGDDSGVYGTNGPVRSDPQSGENDGDRQLRVYQEYINRNYQLWGRRIQLYVAQPPSDGEPDVRAAVVKADEEYKAFAVIQHTSAALKEAARRKMVGIGGFQLDDSLYEQNQPYLYAWWIDGTRMMRFQAEYLCKQLRGKRAAFAGDEPTKATTRKFGVLAVETSAWGANPGPLLPAMVKKQCGEDVQIALFGTIGPDPAGFANALTRFRSDGVTTIVPVLDVFDLSAALSAATATNYNPEWIVAGFWEQDVSWFPALFGFDRTQWGRAFGLSGLEMAQRPEATDWYQAYKEVDPAREPDLGDDGPWSLFYELLQLANGIQRAGRNLTPETFRDGLLSMPKHAGGPVWSHAGGYAPGDFSYSDDVAEIYYDSDAPNPSGAHWVGTYRYPECGRRWSLGSIPVRDPDVFRGGCTEPPP